MAANNIRRLVDIIAAIAGLVILSPLLISIALWIRLDSPGPIFFRANRIGRYGKPFRLYKFRSMVNNADKQGPGITAGNDTRVTKAGRFVRRTKIDELPQLINVLRGEMSLVGPRPEDPRYVALYNPTQYRVLDVRPGITSAASLAYRHEESLLVGPDWETLYREKVLPDKLAIDLAYLEQRTLLSDLRLVFKTILSTFR
jgi:lipopolysaccharide/colanic/teichoic acid biosynthesis glycosyltransferase